MKKIFFSFLAIAALSSCAKTEVAYVEANSEIKLAPTTSIATKAGYKGAINDTKYPTAESFDVYGYWSADWNANGAVVDYLLTDKTSGVEFVNLDQTTWKGAITYHWPKDGSLKFAAYSPSSVDFAHDYATDTYSKTGYVHPHETDKTWDLLFSKTTADYTAMTAASGVPVVFDHALSWITLKVVAEDAMAAQAFDIKKVTINDVCTQADLSASMAAGQGVPADSWSNQTLAKDMVVFSGDQLVTMELKDIESTAKGTIVIPQAPTKVTIDYTQKEFSGTAQLENQTIVLDLVLDQDGAVWEPGKHYTYTLVFGVDEISITPSVIMWDDVQIENDQALTDQNLIQTTAQFEAAIATKRPNIILGSDIVLTSEMTKITNDLVLDLNGFNITTERNVVSGATSAEIATLYVDGVELTVTGTGSIKNNGVKAGYAIVVDNGAKVTIKGDVTVGSYYDAYYVKTGTLVIENGFHYATEYSAPKIDAQGCHASTVINCYDDAAGKVSITGGTFVNMDPSDVHEWRLHHRSFVAEGYTVVSEQQADGSIWYTVVKE